VGYLLDSNVWLDVIVGGPHSQKTIEMLRRAKPGTLATTDFVTVYRPSDFARRAKIEKRVVSSLSDGSR
jgi:hypothetical protein